MKTQEEIVVDDVLSNQIGFILHPADDSFQFDPDVVPESGFLIGRHGITNVIVSDDLESITVLLDPSFEPQDEFACAEYDSDKAIEESRDLAKRNLCPKSLYA